VGNEFNFERPRPAVMVGGCICAETDGITESHRRANGATFFQFAFRYYANSPGRRRPRRGRENPENVVRAMQYGFIGSPETIRRSCGSSSLPHRPDHPAQPGGKNTHQQICESLELFAGEVMGNSTLANRPTRIGSGVFWHGKSNSTEIDTTGFTDRTASTASKWLLRRRPRQFEASRQQQSRRIPRDRKILPAPARRGFLAASRS
jgi:hypothetical protein